jgi:hypothetical protein
MTQPPYGQPQRPGYPQPQGHPPQQFGHPQQPAHSQLRPGHPQAGYVQQPQGPGSGRVIGIVIAAIAIIIGLYIFISVASAMATSFSTSALPFDLVAIPAGLSLVAGGVLLILRSRIAPLVLVGGSVLVLVNLVEIIVVRATALWTGTGIALFEIIPPIELAVFITCAIVSAIALLPAVRKPLKPKTQPLAQPYGPQPGHPQPGHPQHPGGYPQGYPQQSYPQQGYPQQQGYAQQPGDFPQQ